MGTVPHYPSYDVMHEAEAWDNHTREIVQEEAGPIPPTLIVPDPPTKRRPWARSPAPWSTMFPWTYWPTSSPNATGACRAKSARTSARPASRPKRTWSGGVWPRSRRPRAMEYGQAFRYLTVVQRQDLLGRVERGEMPGRRALAGPAAKGTLSESCSPWRWRPITPTPPSGRRSATAGRPTRAATSVPNWT